MTQKVINIILPALNEEQTVKRVIDEILQVNLEQHGYKVSIFVIDNNSTDKTREVAEASGVNVISEMRRGKGRAVTTAFESVSGDYTFIMDADFTYPATCIPEMLRLLESGFDVVLGSRLKGKMEKGAMSRVNLIGNHLLTLMANVLYGTHISDLCTGYWGFRGSVVRDIKLDVHGFDLEANLLAQIAQRQCRIGEVAINYRCRPTPSKLVGFKDAFKIVKTLVKKKFRRNTPKAVAECTYPL